mgnify:CR=1 FL=1
MKGKIRLIKSIFYLSVTLMLLWVLPNIQVVDAQVETQKLILPECDGGYCGIFSKKSGVLQYIKDNPKMSGAGYKALAQNEIEAYKRAVVSLLASYRLAISNNPKLKERISKNCNRSNIVGCVAALVPGAKKARSRLRYHYGRAGSILKVALVNNKLTKTSAQKFLNSKIENINKTLKSNLLSATPISLTSGKTTKNKTNKKKEKDEVKNKDNKSKCTKEQGCVAKKNGGVKGGKVGGKKGGHLGGDISSKSKVHISKNGKRKQNPKAKVGLKNTKGAYGGSGSSVKGSVNGHKDNTGTTKGVTPWIPPVKKKTLDCAPLKEFACNKNDKKAVLNPGSPKVPVGVKIANKVANRFSVVDLKKEAAKKMIEAQVLGYLRQAYANRLVTGKDTQKIRNKIYSACNDNDLRKVILNLNMAADAHESTISQKLKDPKQIKIYKDEIKGHKTKYYNALKLASKELRQLHSQNLQLAKNFDDPPKIIQIEGIPAYLPCVATVAKFVSPLYALHKIKNSKRICSVKNTAFIGMGQFKANDPSIKPIVEFCGNAHRNLQKNSIRMAQIFSQYPELNESVTEEDKHTVQSKYGTKTHTVISTKTRPLFKALGDRNLSSADDSVMKNVIQGMSHEDGSLDRIRKSVEKICDNPIKAGEAAFANEAMTSYFFSCGEADQRTLVADGRSSETQRQAVKNKFSSNKCKKIRNYHTASIACGIRQELNQRKSGFTAELAGTFGMEVVGTALDVGGCFASGAAMGRAFFKAGFKGFVPELVKSIVHFGKAEIVGASVAVGVEVYSDYSLEQSITEQTGRIISGFGSNEDFKTLRNHKKKSKLELAQSIFIGFMAGKAFDFSHANTASNVLKKLNKLQKKLPKLKKEYLALQKLKGSPGYKKSLKKFKKKLADPIANSLQLSKSDVRKLDASTLIALIEVRRGQKFSQQFTKTLKQARKLVQNIENVANGAHSNRYIKNHLKIGKKVVATLKDKIAKMKKNGVHSKVIQKAESELRNIENIMKGFSQRIRPKRIVVQSPPKTIGVQSALRKTWPSAEVRYPPHPAGGQAKGKRIEFVDKGVDGKKQPVGFIHYTVKDGTVTVDQIEVAPSHQKNGMSKHLFQEMFNRIEKSGKKVNVIKGDLAQSNWIKYWEARDSGLSHLQALRQTPAYKARLDAGFGKIDPSRSVAPGNRQELPLLVTLRGKMPSVESSRKISTTSSSPLKKKSTQKSSQSPSSRKAKEASRSVDRDQATRPENKNNDGFAPAKRSVQQSTTYPDRVKNIALIVLDERKAANKNPFLRRMSFKPQDKKSTFYFVSIKQSNVPIVPRSNTRGMTVLSGGVNPAPPYSAVINGKNKVIRFVTSVDSSDRMGRIHGDVARKNYAASKLNQLMGFDTTPSAKIMDIQLVSDGVIRKKRAVVLDFAPGKNGVEYGSRDTFTNILSQTPDHLKDKMRKSIADAELFEFLVGNKDVHLNNFKVDVKTGSLKVFDYDLTFPAGLGDPRSKNMSFGHKLPDKIYPESLQALKKNLGNENLITLRKKFPELTDDEISGILFRRDVILKYAQDHSDVVILKNRSPSKKTVKTQSPRAPPASVISKTEPLPKKHTTKDKAAKFTGRIKTQPQNFRGEGRSSVMRPKLKAVVDQNTVVVDSNIVIAEELRVKNIRDGVPWHRGLNSAHKRSIKFIDQLRSENKKILISDRVWFETKSSSKKHMIKTGIELTISRNSKQWQETMKVLETHKVGAKKGSSDRHIVADIFFAKSKAGVIPQFVTADKKVYNRLAELSKEVPVNDISKLGKAVPIAYPKGFNVTINGRTIRVIPL